jgi:CheY-like chemotaxis protein
MPYRKPILLVDDNINDVELEMNALRRVGVANPVVTARHGGEALDFLYRRGPHAERTEADPAVILLDLKMPLVDGHEVLRQVKADDKLRLIPIVMLTSSCEEKDVLRSYQLGVNAYVMKPVDFAEFVEMIRHLVAFWSRFNILPARK